MGYRLEGPPIAHRMGPDIISDGIPSGGIQVPGDGQPMILLVDRQSTGGYSKIASVISVDIGVVAQAQPGRRIGFRSVTLTEATASSDRQRRGLLKSSRDNRDIALKVMTLGNKGSPKTSQMRIASGSTRTLTKARYLRRLYPGRQNSLCDPYERGGRRAPRRSGDRLDT
jgi:hypothetical protein